MGVLVRYTGIEEEIDARDGLSLCPVPASDCIELRSSRAATPTRISVLDALGRVVLQQKMASNKQHIAVSGLTTGRYAMRVELADPAVLGSSSVSDRMFVVVKNR